MIRPMMESDKEEVLQMMRRFYDSPAVAHTASDAVLARDVAACLTEGSCLDGFVLEQEGQIAGYAMTAKSYTTEYGGTCIWLEDLYLKPEYRHLGLAGAFFRYMEAYYPEAVRFQLEVEPENVFAVQCYQKYGYQISPYWKMTKEREA